MSKTKKTILFFAIALVLFVPILVYAVEPYVPIEEIPLIGKPSEVTAYLKGIFQFGVAAIAIVSMIAIMIGGYLYIFSAGGKTEKAKQMITNALLGLGLALTSWIIVYTINPDLVELRGIQNVKIELSSRTNGTEVIPGNICDILETKWKESRAAVGSLATMVFALGDLCTDKASEIILEGEVWEYDRFSPDNFVSRFTFTKSKGEIVQTLNNGKPSIYWEAKWEVPPILESGDTVYFKVMSKATIDGNVKESGLTGNKYLWLLIDSPTPSASLCEIKEVDWNFPPSKASSTKIEAEYHIRLNSNCLDLNATTRLRKFALRIEIFNRGNGADHAKTSEKVFQHTDVLNDVLVLMPFIIPPPVPPPDWLDGTYLKTSVTPGNYFIEVTVVYADDHTREFTPTVRSTRGKDLMVQ